MKYYINDKFLIPEDNMYYEKKEEIADFKLIEINENADFCNIDLNDFDIIEEEYVFNYERHIKRIAVLKSNYITAVYKNNIAIEIRKKYSLEDEIAILRQKDNKPNEYFEYFNYVEKCKTKASKDENK